MFQVCSTHFLKTISQILLNILLFSRLSAPPITSMSLFGDSIAMTNSHGSLLACGRSQAGSGRDYECYEYVSGGNPPLPSSEWQEEALGTWEKVEGMGFRSVRIIIGCYAHKLQIANTGHFLLQEEAKPKKSPGRKSANKTKWDDSVQLVADQHGRRGRGLVSDAK